MKTWVVMMARHGPENYWAWCRPHADHPGFDEIYYTSTDGVKTYDPPGGELPQLLTLVFVAHVAEEDSPTAGTTFPAAREPDAQVPEPAGDDGAIELTRRFPADHALQVDRVE